MDKLMEGMVAIVTGGGTGVGEATARVFAAEGCKVVVAGRRKEPLERVAAEVGGVAVPADITSQSDVAHLVEECEDAYGRLDVLVNNAAVGNDFGSIETLDVDAFNRTLTANAGGVMLCMKLALPALRRTQGTIVNVSSTAGILPNTGQIAYGASKAAIINVTKSIAREVGKYGIRVNVICPGAIDTELYREGVRTRLAGKVGSIEEETRKYASDAALGRLTTPREVATGIYFLATSLSGTMTGNAIVMDGGKKVFLP